MYSENCKTCSNTTGMFLDVGNYGTLQHTYCPFATHMVKFYHVFGILHCLQLATGSLNEIENIENILDRTVSLQSKLELGYMSSFTFPMNTNCHKDMNALPNPLVYW